MEVNDVSLRGMLWDVDEEHLCKEIILNAKDFGEIILHRLQCQVLLALFLIWLCVLVEILQIDFTKSIEDLENVGQKLLIYLLFAVIEVLILRIEALNICLRSDEFLHERDELTATHVVNEIKNDKW